MLVLMGLTGPLECSTCSGSSQEVMVSLETAPDCSFSGCPLRSSSRRSSVSLGWRLFSVLSGSEGSDTCWLLLVLWTRERSRLTRRTEEGLRGLGSSAVVSLMSSESWGLRPAGLEESDPSRRFSWRNRRSWNKHSSLLTFNELNNVPSKSTHRNRFFLKSNIDTKSVESFLIGRITIDSWLTKFLNWPLQFFLRNRSSMPRNCFWCRNLVLWEPLRCGRDRSHSTGLQHVSRLKRCRAASMSVKKAGCMIGRNAAWHANTPRQIL